MLNFLLPKFSTPQYLIHVALAAILSLLSLENVQTSALNHSLSLLFFIVSALVIGMSFLKLSQSQKRSIGIEEHIHKISAITMLLTIIYSGMTLLGLSFFLLAIIFLITVTFFLITNVWLINLQKKDKSEDPVGFLSHE